MGLNKKAAISLVLAASLIALIAYLRTTSLKISSPTTNANVCSPVTVTVSWTGRLDASTFKAMLGNTNVTAAFGTIPANSPANASLSIVPGSPQLTVSAVVAPRILAGFTTVQTLTDKITLVTDQITLDQNNLSLAPNAKSPLKVSRTCSNPATAPLSVGLRSDNAVLADVDMASVSLPAQSPSEATVQVSSYARPGKTAIKSSVGSGSQATAGPIANVTVKRALGCFTHVNPNTTSGATNPSPDGVFNLAIRTQMHSPPPPSLQYFARFSKGANGNETSFYTDTLGGGAAFCSASNAGAALSGYGGLLGHSSNYFFALTDLLKTPMASHEFEAWSKNMTVVAYVPVLQFSQDCSLALIASANNATTPNPYRLTIIDVPSGSILPNGEQYFGGANVTSNVIQACVADTPTGQQVNITIDNVAQTPVKIP